MSEQHTIKPLSVETWPDFAQLVECNGAFGGCWCVGFHAPEARVPGETERDQKLRRVQSGTTHAALIYVGDQCVGWTQFGSPEELPRIKSRKEYDKECVALPDWRIACCYVGKGHRRQGAAAAGLAGALRMIAELGGGVVEGYPEPSGAVPAGFLFNGALSTYEQLGFIKQRMIGKHRWVVSRVVEPA